jgi:hypothetical protein
MQFDQFEMARVHRPYRRRGSRMAGHCAFAAASDAADNWACNRLDLTARAASPVRLLNVTQGQRHDDEA